MYPVFFRRKRWFRLALASLAIGTAIFLPQLGLLENWAGYLLVPLYIGGFVYLLWQGELLRAWNRERQVQRKARTFALRGLQLMWIGYLPIGFDLLYSAASRSYYPYRYFGQSAGGSMVMIGTIVLGVGLLMDWRAFPKAVDRSARRALIMMKDAGFEIDDTKLWVGIDSAISRFGYSGESYRNGDDYVVQVPPASVYSQEAGGLDQTMVHEMSHVYLRQKNHPSHLEKTNEEASRRKADAYRKKWQIEILSSVMIYPREVFVEDLTFKILKTAKGDWARANLQYFGRLSMRKQKIFNTHRKRGNWRNAWLILRNSYYSAEMERYQIPDPIGIMKRTNERILSSLRPIAETAFNYFHQIFLGLTDDITAEDYKKTLDDYLSKFIGLAEGRNGT